MPGVWGWGCILSDPDWLPLPGLASSQDCMHPFQRLALATFATLLFLACGPHFTEPNQGPGKLPGRWKFEDSGGIGGTDQPETISFDFQASGVVLSKHTWGSVTSSWQGKWTLRDTLLTVTKDTC